MGQVTMTLEQFHNKVIDEHWEPHEVDRIKDVTSLSGDTIGDEVLFLLKDPSHPNRLPVYAAVYVPKKLVAGENDRVDAHGASDTFPDAGRVTEITWLTADHGKPPKFSDFDKFTIMSLTGISLDYDTLLENASANSSADRYAYMVSLLNGALRVHSGKGGDDIEVGETGKAVVKAGGGDDTVWVWHQKTILYDGGNGSDTIAFDYQNGFAPQPDHGATVNLAAGTATNPFGGKITLKNVENVVGQFGASNDLKGDAHANHLRGGTLADDIQGFGGNDSVYIKYNAGLGDRATHADGGTGTDTLTTELTYMGPFIGSGFDQKAVNTLDLTNQANNTGSFQGGSFTHFEIFKVVQDFNTLFYFKGSSSGEKAYGAGFEDKLDGGGGNDLLAGGFAADELTGGGGGDLFWFRYATDSNAAGEDTIIDFSHAQHDKIDLSKIYGPKLDFIGADKFHGHAGELHAVKQGGDTLVETDTNGDKTADFALLLDGGPKVVAGDFIL